MDWIDTEHLLLGMLDTRDSMGCLILQQLDVDSSQLYNQLKAMLRTDNAEHDQASKPEVPEGPIGHGAPSRRRLLLQLPHSISSGCVGARCPVVPPPWTIWGGGHRFVVGCSVHCVL